MGGTTVNSSRLYFKYNRDFLLAKLKEEDAKVKTREASLVLIVMLAILGTGVIKWGLSPQTPVLLVLGLTIWAKIRGLAGNRLTMELNRGSKPGLSRFSSLSL